MQDGRLKDFLNEFTLSDSQLQEVYKRFNNEIRKGLAKETHAQADTKCYVTYVQDLPTGEERGQFLALDLGGTNFRVLLVTLKGNRQSVVESTIYSLPKEIILGAGTLLFDHIASCLSTFVKEKNLCGTHLPLGFTFSFPCTQVGLTQGVLMRWTKGFQCSGVENEDVGRMLKDAIARRDDLEIDMVAILNDTTGTMMSCAYRNPDCRIGIIIGTGCNICYVENVENVELLEPELKQDKKHVVINTECGAFGDSGTLDFIRTSYDRQVDNMSTNKGHQIYEKMISGKYLGELVQVVLLKALEANIIFVLTANKSSIINILSKETECFQTSFISEIEADTFPSFTKTRDILREVFGLEKASIEDCQKLKIICEYVSKRAAALGAVGLSALINRIDTTKVVVGVDGTVFRCHPKFEAYMRETLKKFVKANISFELMLSEDGSGRGAALVAAVASRKV